MPKHEGNWPCQSLPGAACDLHLGCWLKEWTRPKALGLLIAVGQQRNNSLLQSWCVLLPMGVLVLSSTRCCVLMEHSEQTGPPRGIQCGDTEWCWLSEPLCGHR